MAALSRRQAPAPGMSDWLGRVMMPCLLLHSSSQGALVRRPVRRGLGDGGGFSEGGRLNVSGDSWRPKLGHIPQGHFYC